MTYSVNSIDVYSTDCVYEKQYVYIEYIYIYVSHVLGICMYINIIQYDCMYSHIIDRNCITRSYHNIANTIFSIPPPTWKITENNS